MRRGEFLKMALGGGCGIAASLSPDESERAIVLDAGALFGGLEAARVELRGAALVMDARKWRPDWRGVVVTDVIDLGDDGVLSGRVSARDLRVEAEATPGVPLEVRTGSTYFQSPGSWSAWTPVNGLIQPHGRYAQVRLQLPARNRNTPSEVRRVTLRCLVRNLPAEGKVRVVSDHIQRIVRSPIEFAYERPGQADVAWMRREFRLDDVIASGRTEFEKLRALMHWVATRLNVRPGPWEARNEPFPWNIRQVMTPADGGTIYSHCMSYCEAMITAATALGWQARHWALLGVRDTGHEVPEIWVDELGKWVFFDPSLDTYYADPKSGTPLNLLEMHNTYLKTVLRPDEVQQRGRRVNEDRLRAVRGKHPVKCMAGGFCYGKPCAWDWEWDHGYLSAGWMQMTPRNDWHSRPEPRFRHFGEGAEGFSGFPMYIDRQTPLTQQVSLWLTRERDFWWTMNQASLRLTRSGADTLDVECGNSQPFFRRYLGRRSGGPWEPVEPRFIWRLTAGENRLEVIPENESGKRGLGSYVVVDFEPQA
jgi:hypothetical protein